ncbi:hypothetical protein MARPO_0006s0282 [Marchantia polymorpha]|uniref:Uncharacterized protein n=1 Tax=Marchantia polymorpha TaxID=3197 RepID=A0A2R6XQ94_MARPO|nr:hypothetical protein MARPO_0006s0282 [Marchantia polymorpha]|eukprot:PTQ48290.1 hypothetical protein MARPO_0006s0282 [Marchantia polymorpha]
MESSSRLELSAARVQPAPWILSIPDEIKKGAIRKGKRMIGIRACISPVPLRILNAGSEDYRVQIINLGLYTRSRVKMTAMDRVRFDVVNSFMELFELRWDVLCEKVVGSEENAHTFLDLYDETLRDRHLDASSAMSSLTLDAVFLTVLLCIEIYSKLPEPQGGLKQLQKLRQIFTEVGVACNLHQIFSDVWVIPNQIPLRLIGKVLNLVKNSPSPEALIKATVDEALRRFKFPCARADVHPQFLHCTHLLECLYITMCPPGESNVSPQHTERLSSPNECWTTCGHICGWCTKHATISSGTGEQQSQPGSVQKQFRTASELRKAGIRVKGIDAGVTGTAFERSTFHFTAVLSLPKIHVTVDTRRILRNLCAYELAKTTPLDSQKLIGYLSVLNNLIDTADDVRLLRQLQSSVLSVSLPGDDADQQVADLFNNLLQNYSSTDIQYTADLRNLHYDVSFLFENELRNICIRNFGRIRHEAERFLGRLKDRPWLMISLLAATILLAMTGIQTAYTVLGYYRP